MVDDDGSDELIMAVILEIMRFAVAGKCWLHLEQRGQMRHCGGDLVLCRPFSFSKAKTEFVAHVEANDGKGGKRARPKLVVLVWVSKRTFLLF